MRFDATQHQSQFLLAFMLMCFFRMAFPESKASSQSSVVCKAVEMQNSYIKRAAQCVCCSVRRGRIC